MPAIQHFDQGGTQATVTAQPTAGVVTYVLDGQQHPGPVINFAFDNTPGGSRSLDIRFVGPGGAGCPVTIQHGTQIDFDFLASVTGAPPSQRDHAFVTMTSALEVGTAASVRTFQLTGKKPSFGPKKASATKKKGSTK